MQKILPQYIISAAKTTGIGVRHPRSGGYLFLNLSSVFALAMSFNHFKNIYQVSQNCSAASAHLCAPSREVSLQKLQYSAGEIPYTSLAFL